MPILLIGRILGGLSTTLLFTAFESWMISEHRRRGFDESWMAETFAWAAAGNGIMAILAGFLAQVAADVNGDIGPFQLAILLTVLTLIVIAFWNENYGEEHKHDDKAKQTSGEKNAELTFFESLFLVVQQPRILVLGLGQACFEGAVYTFGNFISFCWCSP